MHRLPYKYFHCHSQRLGEGLLSRTWEILVHSRNITHKEKEGPLLDTDTKHYWVGAENIKLLTAYIIYYHIVHLGKGKVWVFHHGMDCILYMTFFLFLGIWDTDGGSHQMIDCENESNEK